MAGRARPSEARRLPERSCVACRTPRPKRELVRIVRTPAGTVVIDPTGRLPGRGAYLCSDASCWSQAARRRALEHAFKTSIPNDLAEILAAGPPGPAEPIREHMTSDEGGAHGQE